MKIIKKIGLLSLVVIMGGLYAPAAKAVEPLTKDDKIKIMHRIRALQQRGSELVKKYNEGIKVRPISKEKSEQLMEIEREINNIHNEIVSIYKEFNIPIFGKNLLYDTPQPFVN